MCVLCAQLKLLSEPAGGHLAIKLALHEYSVVALSFADLARVELEEQSH
jgi:hypothetical protein